MHRMASVAIVGLLAAGAALVGCERKANVDNKGTDSGAPKLPAGLFVDAAPADAQAVGAAKADADADGKDIVLTGRIGGRVEPFSEGVAQFLLTDTSIKTCDEIHGDTCPTPWDYCCEPKDNLLAHMATIQVVDDAGKVLRMGLKGQQGLEPKAEIVVAGEVASRAGGTLVINAKRIYVKPAS